MSNDDDNGNGDCVETSDWDNDSGDRGDDGYYDDDAYFLLKNSLQNVSCGAHMMTMINYPQ